MRRYVHNILAGLLCVCLLVSYMPLPASAVEGEAAPSVSGEPQTVMDGSVARGTTAVKVLTVGLSIAGKTRDVTASIGDIMKDASLANDERVYLLKVVVEGADPATCEYAWTRAIVNADGTETPDDSFSDDRAVHPLVDDAKAGLLKIDASYRYTVQVTDPATKEVASASIGVSISDDYLDRTIVHAATDVSVSGVLLRSLSDADFSVEVIAPSSPAFGFVQQAAEGMEIQAAWQTGLPGAVNGKAPFIGSLEVALPAQFDDGTVVSVVHIDADGKSSVTEALVEGGKVVIETASLGAFAVAVPASRTYSVSAEAGEGGSVSPAGTTSYAEGAEPVYTFLPDAGHALDTVTVDGRPAQTAGNSYHFAPLASDHELRATFKEVVPSDTEHSVTARVLGSHGLVSLDGATPSDEQAVQAKHGEGVLVRFAPDEGYAIDRVTIKTGDGDPVAVGVFGDEYLIAAVEADMVVEVSYRAGSTPPAPVHVVTAGVAAGKGSVSPERVEVAHGGSATFTFVPADGWHIAGVTLDGGDVTGRVLDGALEVENIVEDHAVLVTFEKDAQQPAEDFVTVDASAGSGGTVSPAGEVILPKSGSQTFYFYPDDGKRVAEVVMDGRSFAFSGSSYTLFDVRANTSIRVEFANVEEGRPTPPQPVTHTVTATAGPGGSVSPTGATMVIEGGSLLVALVPQTGYLVDEVTVDGKVVQRGGTSYRVVDVRSDVEVAVTFKRQAEPDAPLVNVEVRVEVHAEGGFGGAVSPSESLRMVRGSSQTFYVYPDEGFDLERILVNDEEVQAHPVTPPVLRMARAGGSTGCYSFVMDEVLEDTQVSVFFRKLANGEQPPVPVATHEVRATATAGGLISPEGVSLVPDGGSLSFTLQPDEGFRLASLTVDGRDATGEVAGGVFKLDAVTEDRVLAASFEPVPAEPERPAFTTVHASAGEGGAVTPSGDIPVRTGGSQTFAFLPDEGYVLDKVTVDGSEVVPIDGAYTLFDIVERHEVRATFRPRIPSDPEPVLPQLRTVTATADEGGTVTPSGEVRVVNGSSIAFAFRADEGYSLKAVSLDGEDATEMLEDGVLALEGVVENHAIHATFAREDQGGEEPPAPPAAVHTLTAHVDGGHGSVSPEGAVNVAEGADQTFYFHPDEGYVVGEVRVDGERAAWSPKSWTFEDVRADHELTVTFKPAVVAAPNPDPSGPVEAVKQAVASLTKTGDAPWTLVAGLAVVAGLAAMVFARSRRSGAPSDRR